MSDMSALRLCPAMLVSAPASGAGKTTITAALARHHRNQGLRVRVFKTGPDFLDPMILERASGNPVYQLDAWMGGEEHCRQLLYEAAGEADLILIEGVMGLFDGAPSSADLAIQFGIPVLAVIDASAMAQTFGAVAHGLATYRNDLRMAGIFANRISGQRHFEMLEESLNSELRILGWLARDSEISLPERHLGLMQAVEIADLDKRLDHAAAALILTDGALPAPVEFRPARIAPCKQSLSGMRIACARDAAFSFLYRANLDLLRACGAELQFFSPLTDQQLPPADAVYLPGGYPELHLAALENNHAMQDAIRAHHAAGKPIVAECGGMLYLLESLSGIQGQRGKLTGLLPGKAFIQTRLANLGKHSAALPEGELRGHTFHYSQMECPLTPLVWSEPTRAGQRGEPVYRLGRLTASYMHFYFPSNPQAAAALFLP